MSEVLFGVLFLSFLLFHVWTIVHFRKEREDLVKAILAKSLTDYSTAKVIEKPAQTKRSDEIVPFEEVSNDQFQKMIEKERERTNAG